MQHRSPDIQQENYHNHNNIHNYNDNDNHNKITATIKSFLPRSIRHPILAMTKSDHGKRRGQFPGPKALPVLGNLLDIDLSDTFNSVIEIAPIFTLEIGGSREIMICSRDLLDELCDETRFHKVVVGGVEKLRPLAGDGLFTAQHGNHDWAVAHRILMPLFGPLKIREMFPDMQDVGEQLCLKWARVGPSATIDVANDFTRLTLDTIALCTMNYRFNSFYSNEKMHPFIESMAAALVDADKQAMLPDIIGSCRIRALSAFRKHVASMRELCRELIQDRRKNPVEGKDLFNAMLQGTDPKTGSTMSDESIVQNLITFLIAGHETTSGLLSFTFYYLLENPSVMKKAREEIDAVVGDSNLNVDHLPKLPYINMILRETLRLMPTAPGFYVTPFKDETIGGEYHVNSGEPLFCFLHLIHRDPAVWGPDAEEFRPERMADEFFDKLPKNAWKPFGNGMRGCIGREFAWQEAQLATIMILQNFDLVTADPNYKLKVKQSLTIKPDGFNVHVKLREVRKLHNLFKAPGLSSLPPSSRASRQNVDLTDAKGLKPISIFYGSNTGTCEALAQRLSADCASFGFMPPEPLPLDSATENLSKDGPNIILAASYDGRPSDNAEEFAKWAESLQPGDLEGVQFAVFGCGHKDWVSTLFKVPKILDKCLADAGAERLVEIGVTDTSKGRLYSDFDDWTNGQLFPELVKRHGGAPMDAQVDSQLELSVTINQPHNRDMSGNFRRAEVVENQLLTYPGVPRKHSLLLKLPKDVTYTPGDHVLVLPKNPPQLVEQVMSCFGINGDTVLTVSSTRPTFLPTDTPIFASNLFSSLVELSQTISRTSLKRLVDFVGNKQTKGDIYMLAGELYEKEIDEKRVSILDILRKYPSINMPVSTFLSMLPQMRPRTYSFASALEWKTGHGMLLFSVVEAEEALAGSFARPGGLASNYMAQLQRGDSILIEPRACRPELRVAMTTLEPKFPTIMIAVGAGLAPFLGYLQKRYLETQRGQHSGALTTTLLFGCRGANKDDICRDILDEYSRAGVVSVHRAYSRDPTSSSKYVQDLVTKHNQTLAKLWGQGAVIMICSGKKVSDGVLDVLSPILLAEDRRLGLTDTYDCDVWRKNVGKERLILEVFG
ncbi:Bifunctional cytochrome P450/NADPH--P450 reductase [Fusarium oxysporum f. sp. narcissi]|uniref:Bifunctional cytochrome P450/NADPH--P450 reductase n=1 Tax=Fusarium oxysporum f. sp. narcissi TaxID=451672 RepID=A0A4Q2UYW2_FUSOX|nr:Bifunctional cytochrome P450/NADPH--P450 reductase [Fusarium oxysporum f. sp. narcissi]